MENVAELIKARRSVRTYDGRALDETTKETLISYANSIRNPFDIPVEFRFLDADRDSLSCPVVTGTKQYIAGKIRCVPDASVAFGYSFEEFILYALSLGLGTVWVGGTMNRDAYEKAMDLADDEMMPCVSPLGYAAADMSLRERMMRKGVRADDRLPFEELFYDGSLNVPLTMDKAGRFANALEMVRLAPSAVNKQPWRAVVKDDTVRFYLKRSKGFSHSGKLDMQAVDMGIALCHFALTTQADGLELRFVKETDTLFPDPEWTYIASFLP